MNKDWTVENQLKYTIYVQMWSLDDILKKEKTKKINPVLNIAEHASDYQSHDSYCFAIDKSKNLLFCGRKQSFIKIFRIIPQKYEGSEEQTYSVEKFCCYDILHKRVKKRFKLRNNGYQKIDAENDPFSIVSLEVIESKNLLIICCIKPFS